MVPITNVLKRLELVSAKLCGAKVQTLFDFGAVPNIPSTGLVQNLEIETKEPLKNIIVLIET